MKLAIVVQRYGADINGGAELHARYIAERLARHADVRVLTTCARDYVTWRNDLPAGSDTVNGVPVERFPVAHERNELDFGRRSTHVFTRQHSLHDELDWLDSEGPASPDLINRITVQADEFDYVILFSARYYHAYHGARSIPGRAVLVPTAERDPALGLALFGPIFRGVRAIMYNSFEEQALIHAVSSNEQVPGVIVGVGSDIPRAVEPARARQKFGLTGPYVIYVGRIDVNKGCAELFDFFIRYVDGHPHPPTLVLIGTPVIDIPVHPRIRHLGFVDDQDKFDAIAGATALIMPSYYESLSMVALEAWALGTPVVANARCDVLLGQCLRSNAACTTRTIRSLPACSTGSSPTAASRQRSDETAGSISSAITAGPSSNGSISICLRSFHPIRPRTAWSAFPAGCPAGSARCVRRRRSSGCRRGR